MTQAVLHVRAAWIELPVVAGNPPRTRSRRHTVPWRGQSAAELADEFLPDLPARRVFVRGGEVLGEDLQLPMCPGTEVVVIGSPAGPLAGVALFIGKALLLAAVSAGLSLAFAKLFPEKPGPTHRGEDQSQTHAFDGMQTDFGPGGAIPVVYGEHDTAGHVVATNIEPTSSGDEILSLTVVLAAGRIDSVGGIQADPSGETGRLGSFGPNLPTAVLPGNIRVNGTTLDNQPGRVPGAEAWLRLGELDQSPVPEVNFSSPTTAVGVQARLDDVDDNGSGLVPVDNIRRVWVLLRFPNGLFGLSGTGQAVPIARRFRLEYRTQGGAWLFAATLGSGGVFTVNSHPTPRTPFTFRAGFFPSGPNPNVQVTPPVEVRVTRLDPRGTAQESDACVFTTIIYGTAENLAYPGIAYLGLKIKGSEKFSGGRPNLRIRLRGKRVRVWMTGPLGTFSEPTWDVPENPPFNFHLHPPGSNPAWVLLDFLLSDEGLGEFIDASRLDLQSFRDLADYCDQEIAPGIPRFRFDDVFDVQESAFDLVLRILQCCQGSLVQQGNTFAVRYSYRDAHGTVPARATFAGGRWHVNFEQVFSSANLAELRLQRNNPAYRPTVLECDFLNRALDYERDTVTQEDPDAPGLNDPGSVLNAVGIIKRPVRYWGATRASQCRYMALITHNINRLTRWSGTVNVGTEGILLDVGSLIGLQSDALKPLPFGSIVTAPVDSGLRDSFGVRLLPGFSGSQTFIKLDRALTIPAGQDWAVFVLDNAGDFVEGRIPQDPSPRVFAAGDPIDVFDPLAPATPLSIDYRDGLPVAIGPLDRTVVPFEVVGVTQDPRLGHVVEVTEWAPEMFDVDIAIVTSEDFGGSGDETRKAAVGPLTAGYLTADVSGSDPIVYDQVEGLKVEAGADQGQSVVLWEIPPGSQNRTVRVYARPSGSQLWDILGESDGGRLETVLLAPGQGYELAAAIADAFGAFTLPERSAQLSVVVDEFPPLRVPEVEHFQAEVLGEGVLFTWAELDPREIEYYELRAGPIWTGGQRIARVRGTRFLYRAAPATVVARRFWLRARSRTGLYSAAFAFVDLTIPVPQDRVEFDTSPFEDLVTGAGGTHDGTQWNAAGAWLELVATRNWGVYTSPEFDLGTRIVAWWSVLLERRWEQLWTPADLVGVLPHSGELRWWTVSGREASMGKRGIVFGTTVGEWTGVPVSAFEGVPARGPHAHVGEHARVQVLARFHDGTAWGSYEEAPTVDVRHAQKAQVQLRMDREDENYSLRAGPLRVVAAY